MDPFYNKTVTIFNRYDGDGPMGSEVWLSTLLENVRLLETEGANITTSGLSTADSARLHIRTENLPKEYKTPKEWQNLSSEDKVNAFTLTQGIDFFVKGDCTSEDLSREGFFGYMKEKYDSVYKVTTVDIYELIPHMEVGGK